MGESELLRLAAVGVPPAKLVSLQPKESSQPGAPPEFIQMVIISDNLMHAIRYGIDNYEEWRHTDKVLSRERAKMWEVALQARIEMGEPLKE